MTNSYGFDGDIPDGAIAVMYDSENGEDTGMFYYTPQEIEDGYNDLHSPYTIVCLMCEGSIYRDEDGHITNECLCNNRS